MTFVNIFVQMARAYEHIHLTMCCMNNSCKANVKSSRNIRMQEIIGKGMK